MPLITCPGCQRTVRVPDDMLGQRTQCPLCRALFEAPTLDPSAGLTEPRLVRRNPFAQSRTFGPGVALIFAGLLGMVVNGVKVAKAYTDPEAFARETREVFDRAGMPNLEVTVQWMPRVRVGFLALSALVVAGGAAMLAQRWHGLAMLGSVGALFNVADCCCVLGFPVGAWGLYVLRDPTVRALFDRPVGASATPPA